MNFFDKIIQSPNAFKGYLFGDPRRNGEYRFLRILMNSITTRPVIVFDVGANVGEYANAILHLHNQARVHCFEPSGATFQQLSQNLSSVQRIVLENMALSSSPGFGEFFVYGKLDERNSLEKHTELPEGECEKQVVRINSIDTYCVEKGIQHINFVKIDVEGHELKVLQGASQMLLQKRIDVIQFEYNVLWKNTLNTLEGAMEILKNYKIFRLTPWGKIYIRKYSKALEVYPLASNYVAFAK